MREGWKCSHPLAADQRTIVSLSLRPTSSCSVKKTNRKNNDLLLGRGGNLLSDSFTTLTVSFLVEAERTDDVLHLLWNVVFLLWAEGPRVRLYI